MEKERTSGMAGEGSGVGEGVTPAGGGSVQRLIRYNG